MSATSEDLSDIMGVGPDVETFGAINDKIDLREFHAGHFISSHRDRPRLALHDLPLPGQLVERNSVFLDR
jgi:hypothetical protein